MSEKINNVLEILEEDDEFEVIFFWAIVDEDSFFEM